MPHAATRSASASRSSTRKRERPRPTLRYGSAGTKSVHPTGTEQREPSGCSTVTRSSPQSCLATTNRNVWPRRGWNGWTIRISGGSTAPAVVDSFGESVRGASHRVHPSRVPRPLLRGERGASPPALAQVSRLLQPLASPSSAAATTAPTRETSNHLHGAGLRPFLRSAAGSITVTSASPDHELARRCLLFTPSASSTLNFRPA